MGEKCIETYLNKKQVKETPVSIVAWTAWKEDFTEDHWTALVLNPQKILREALYQEGLDTALVSVWGRSCRAGRNPCSPLKATSMQIHSSVHEDQIENLLGRSGYNGWHATPKAKGGRALETRDMEGDMDSASEANSHNLVHGAQVPRGHCQE